MNELSEATPVQFFTTGGCCYTIRVSTDIANDQACNIHVEPYVPKQQKSYEASALTVRENEVARLVQQGYTNLEIADELCISLSTVKCHLQNIYSKLGVGNRTMLSSCLMLKSA